MAHYHPLLFWISFFWALTETFVFLFSSCLKPSYEVLLTSYNILCTRWRMATPSHIYVYMYIHIYIYVYIFLSSQIALLSCASLRFFGVHTTFSAPGGALLPLHIYGFETTHRPTTKGSWEMWQNAPPKIVCNRSWQYLRGFYIYIYIYIYIYMHVYIHVYTCM